MKKWLGLVLGVSALALVIPSCGGDNGATFPNNEGGFGGDDGAFSDDGGFGTDGQTGCVPATCTDFGYTCGPNGDGCGSSSWSRLESSSTGTN